MRTIKLANDKKRDAQVGFEVIKEKSDIQVVHPECVGYENVSILKSTLDNETEDLLKEFGTPLELGQAILNGDPEIDFEKAGMFIRGGKKIYVTNDNKIVYRVHQSEVVYNVDGTVREERDYKETVSNINDDLSAIHWSGKLIPKELAIRKFVFTRAYQIKHVNGLTYDFLYAMAKQLADSNSMMLIGSGSKGAGPLVFSNGGVQYKGFLEGRVDGEKYCLILHLSNLEMKDLC